VDEAIDLLLSARAANPRCGSLIRISRVRSA